MAVKMNDILAKKDAMFLEMKDYVTNPLRRSRSESAERDVAPVKRKRGCQ